MSTLDICVPYRPRPDLDKVAVHTREAWEREIAGNTNISLISRGGDGYTWRPGTARNDAARAGRALSILFADVDMFIEPGGLDRILVDAATMDENTITYYTNWLNPNRPEFEEQWLASPYERGSWYILGSHGRSHNWNQTTTYGPILISRALFERVGGWCEDFVGWGGEDDDFTVQCRKAGAQTVIRSSPRFVHMLHTRTNTLFPETNRLRNVELLMKRSR